MTIEKEGYGILDSKCERNSDLYESLADELKRGFTKSGKQCRIKFKALKTTFVAEKLKTSGKSGEAKA